MTTYNDIEYGQEIYCDDTTIYCDNAEYYCDGSTVFLDEESEA